MQNSRDESIVHVVEEPTVFNRELSELYQPPGRKIYQDTNEHQGLLFDHDDDKYKRRPPTEWMKRWWKYVLIVYV